MVRHRREATRHGTTARTRSPSEKPSPSKSSSWSSSTRYASRTVAQAPVAVELDPAGVSDLSAARGIERRLAQLRQEEPVARASRAPRPASARPSSRTRRTRSGSRRAAANSAARRSSREIAARERSRCCSISGVNSSSLTPRPRSRASSCVSSSGKPYVSWRRNASSPEMSPPRCVTSSKSRMPRTSVCAEALLLGRQDPVDLASDAPRAPGYPSPICSIDDVGEPRQVRRLEPDPGRLQDRTADDPAHDVAAPLVRRRDAVRGEEGHAAAVVGEDRGAPSSPRGSRRTRHRSRPRSSS